MGLGLSIQSQTPTEAEMKNYGRATAALMLASIFMATAAEARPDLRQMSCQQAQNMVRQHGAVAAAPSSRERRGQLAAFAGSQHHGPGVVGPLGEAVELAEELQGLLRKRGIESEIRRPDEGGCNTG